MGKKFAIDLDGAMADKEGVANDGGIVIKKMEKLCFFLLFHRPGKGWGSNGGW